jgi:hypothetical protein
MTLHEGSFNLRDDSENTATLSPQSYPSSINFEHQNEKAEKQEACRG